MLFKNSPTAFGITTKFLHWLMFILVLFQIFTAYWTIYVLPENSPLAGVFIGKLHKPFGVLTFLVVLFSIYWYLVNVKPVYPSAMPSYEKITARVVHRLLLLFLIVMPLSGLLMSVAAGHPPSFFGLFQIPMFIPENKTVSGIFFNVHVYSSYCLIALVLLHTLAALKHQFIDHDQILKRML